MESVIFKVCIIYLIICFIFFVVDEILSNIVARELNDAWKYFGKTYKVNHFKIVIKSIFFPITILMDILDVVSGLIFEKRRK